LRASIQHMPSNRAARAPEKPQNSAIPHRPARPGKNPKTFPATPEILAAGEPDPRLDPALIDPRDVSTRQNIRPRRAAGDQLRTGSAAEPRGTNCGTINQLIYRYKESWFRSSAISTPSPYACARAHPRTHQTVPQNAEPAEPARNPCNYNTITVPQAVPHGSDTEPLPGP
jgi:hypothetical protein